MIADSLTRLEYLCEAVPPLIFALKEEEFCHKPAPGKWSKKEILGHLIDSAANNHQRFVRVQFEENPSIYYDQDRWNFFSFHNTMDSSRLISFWALYNNHLAALVRQIPLVSLKRRCHVGNDHFVSLEFLIKDYVGHMEHHLKQIVKYQ